MKWRPTGPADRQLAVLWAVVAVAVLLLVPLSNRLTQDLPGCPLRVATGVACPSCGTTRALEALAAGDLVAALSWNPLAFAGSLVFVIGGLLAPIWNRRVGRVPDLRGVLFVRVGLVAALVGNWVYLWLRGV
jgi:hypothetical protein